MWVLYQPCENIIAWPKQFGNVILGPTLFTETAASRAGARRFRDGVSYGLRFHFDGSGVIQQLDAEQPHFRMARDPRGNLFGGAAETASAACCAFAGDMGISH